MKRYIRDIENITVFEILVVCSTSWVVDSDVTRSILAGDVTAGSGLMITAGVTTLWTGGGVMTTGAIGTDTTGVALGDLSGLVACILMGGLIHHFELI